MYFSFLKVITSYPSWINVKHFVFLIKAMVCDTIYHCKFCPSHYPLTTLWVCSMKYLNSVYILNILSNIVFVICFYEQCVIRTGQGHHLVSNRNFLTPLFVIFYSSLLYLSDNCYISRWPDGIKINYELYQTPYWWENEKKKKIIHSFHFWRTYKWQWKAHNYYNHRKNRVVEY